MPHRKMTAEQAVDAVAEAIRELNAAASNLERALPDEPHQERAVRVLNYETDELASALPVLRDLIASPTISPLREVKGAEVEVEQAGVES